QRMALRELVINARRVAVGAVHTRRVPAKAADVNAVAIRAACIRVRRWNQRVVVVHDERVDGRSNAASAQLAEREQIDGLCRLRVLVGKRERTSARRCGHYRLNFVLLHRLAEGLKRGEEPGLVLAAVQLRYRDGPTQVESNAILQLE